MPPPSSSIPISFSLDQVPVSFSWTGAAPPTPDQINQIATTIRATPQHQQAALAAYQNAQPKLAPGMDPNVVSTFADSHFGAGSDPNNPTAQRLNKIVALPPEQRAAAVGDFSPVGQAALLQEAWSRSPGDYRMPL